MNRGKLEDLVAEHYDNLYYLNDIFSLNVSSVNDVLEAQVIKRFLIPLYVHSLVPEKNDFEVLSKKKEKKKKEKKYNPNQMFEIGISLEPIGELVPAGTGHQCIFSSHAS